MQLVNHDVITAYEHRIKCEEVCDWYRKRVQYRDDKDGTNDVTLHQLVIETNAAGKHLQDVIESTFKSQRKLQKEIDEINLDQIGLDL